MAGKISKISLTSIAMILNACAVVHSNDTAVPENGVVDEGARAEVVVPEGCRKVEKTDSEHKWLPREDVIVCPEY